MKGDEDGAREDPHVSATGSRPVVHPGWCDPGRCCEGDGEVEHRSAPVVLRAEDARLVLGWVRVDQVGAGQQCGDAELLIDIRYVPSGPVEQVFLTPWGTCGLAELLGDLFARETSQRAPLGRIAQVVGS